MKRISLILGLGLIGLVLHAQNLETTLLEKIILIEKAVARNEFNLDFEVEPGAMLEEAVLSGNINLIQRARTALAAYQALVQKRKNLDNTNFLQQSWQRERNRQAYQAKNSFLDFTSTVSLGVMGLGLLSFSASSVFGDTYYRDFLEASNGSPEQQQAYGMMVIADYVALGSAYLALGGALAFFFFELLR